VFKTVKKIFKIFAIALGALLVASVLVGLFFSNQIGRRVLAEVKKELKTEMDVKHFGIELFSGFPNASLNFKGVTIKDTNGENLLETEKIAFRFGLFSIFDENIDVKSILIDDGALLIHYDRRGRPNYNIFKESKKQSNNSTKGLSIKKAELSGIEVIYENEQSKQESRASIDNATFSGLVSSSRFKMISTADIQVAFVEINGERYMAGTDISYDAQIGVDLDKGKYTFKKCDLFLANSEFDVDGDIQTKKKGTDFDLSFKGRDASLSSIFELLSEEQQAKLKGVKTTGKFSFDGSLNGLLSAKKIPDIKIKFGLRNGKIYGGRIKDPIKDCSFKGHFVAVKGKSRLTIEDIKGYVDNNSFSGDLTIKDLEKPYIDAGFRGAIPISLIYGFLGDDNNAITGKGELKVKDFSLKGYYEQMINPRKVHQIKANGEIIVDDAGFLVKDQEVVMDRGRFVFDQNKLELKDIKVDGIGHEVLLTGYVKNFLPVIFADSINSQKAQLDFLLNISAKELDLQAIMAVLVPESEENKKKESKAAQEDIDLSFASFLHGDFKADIDAFSYGDIHGKDFEGKISFRGVEVGITGDAEAMGGSFGIEGEGYLLDKPKLKTFLVLENIDVKQFFKQTNNFGQDFLTYKSLKGRLDSRMIIDSYWNQKGIFDQKKLTVLAEMRIANGELVNFKMMENFASFIKVQDLRHIKFSQLENWMEIKKGKVYIPTMFIQSNAANLLVSGQHSFDQKISYNIKVNAGQIIAAKFKKHHSGLSPQQAKRKGWLNLYYTIKGTVDQFEYKTDKRTVKKSFAREENRKRRIRRVLNKEFGGASSKTIVSHRKADIHPVDLESSEDFLPEITPTVSTDAPVKTQKPLKKKTHTTSKPEKSTGETEYMEFEEEL